MTESYLLIGGKLLSTQVNICNQRLFIPFTLEILRKEYGSSISCIQFTKLLIISQVRSNLDLRPLAPS